MFVKSAHFNAASMCENDKKDINLIFGIDKNEEWDMMELRKRLR
jgi:hypothetical protein